MAVRHERSFLRRLEAAPYFAYMGLMGLLPVSWASSAGAGLAKLLGPLTSAHSVARKGLSFAFPDMAEPDIKRLLKGMWDNLGRLAGEMPHLKRLRAYVPNSRITVEGTQHLDAVKASGKGAVFVAGHFANWEVMAAAIVQYGVDCQITYRQANNVFVDQHIVKTRQSYGVEVLAAKGRAGGMSIMRALKAGQSIAIMNDQKYNEGVPTQFFGTEVMTADGPSRLARQFDVPIIPISVRRTKGARFIVTFHEPFKADTDSDDAVAIRKTAQRITDFIEARVREYPEQWFWVHRRWDSALYKAPVANNAS